MGRGRAKAKQTKVARQLKYNSGGTGLDRLRAELSGVGQSDGRVELDTAADGEDDALADPEDDEDDEDESDYVSSR